LEGRESSPEPAKLRQVPRFPLRYLGSLSIQTDQVDLAMEQNCQKAQTAIATCESKKVPSSTGLAIDKGPGRIDTRTTVSKLVFGPNP
jgi:hypothetical protein